MDDKKWMNDIRRKMEGFEMSPPEHLWADIERQVSADLAQRKTVGLQRRRMWMAAAVMTGALVMGGGVWLGTHHEEDAVASHGMSHAGVSHPGNQAADARLSQAKTPLFAQMRQSENGSNTVSTVIEDHYNKVEKETPSVPTETDKETSPLPQPPRQKPSTRPSNVHDDRSWDNTLMASAHSDADRFSVSVTAAGLMGANNQQGGYGELMAGSVWQVNSSGDARSENDASDDFGRLEEVIVGNNNREVYTKKKHHQPIKLGVSVNYRLSDRWSLGTGLTYSYLSSELTSGTDDSHYTTQQKLQYVGIPLNVSYTFWQHKRWSVYGTTGGMVEKCVKGKSTTDYVVDGKRQSSQDNEVKEKRPQYSVGAAVGVQAKIADRVGFYLEPGVSYHFDNHSDVINIYKDTPLNFSLGLGFRYSF